MDVRKLTVTYDESTNRKIINGRYKILRKIGQGQFGKVLLGEVIDHSECRDEFVAIKTIDRIDKSQLITKTYISQTTKIKREIQIMKETNHPNIVKLYQVIDDLKFDKILLILEYCKYGEIKWKTYNHYHEKYQKKPFNAKLTLNKILRDVCQGLQYLHHRGIIHRDLKPLNLLINHDNTVKISDFGVSLILQNNTKDDKELGKTMGTPAFFAPELCQFVNYRYSQINPHNRIKIDKRIDLWSLGVVLYCLIFNDLPFSGFNEFELFKNIVNEELKFPIIKQTSKTTTKDIEELALLKDLIKKLLCKNPDDRITLEQVKHHSFTLFDLSSSEKKKFLNFNKEFITQNGPDTGLSGKLKKIFIGSPKPPVKEHSPEPNPIDLDGLEHVDDLLDSYLDDSSSYGSDAEEVVDTTDLLGSLNETKVETRNSDQKNKPLPLKLQDSTFLPPSLFSKAGPNISPSRASPQNSLSDSSPTKFKNIFNKSPSRINTNRAPVTPTNNNFVTIGASSPSSFRALFSPSQKLFSQNKNKMSSEESVNPTISSLTSPTRATGSGSSSRTSGNGKNKISDFMEPNFPVHHTPFQAPSSPLSNGNTSAYSSRKNSVISGLSRITSSSSSLNLHGYMTDNSYSLVAGMDSPDSVVRNHQLPSSDSIASGVFEEDAADTSENADTTILANEDCEVFNNYKSMSDFLGGLD